MIHTNLFLLYLRTHEGVGLFALLDIQLPVAKELNGGGANGGLLDRCLRAIVHNLDRQVVRVLSLEREGELPLDIRYLDRTRAEHKDAAQMPCGVERAVVRRIEHVVRVDTLARIDRTGGTAIVNIVGAGRNKHHGGVLNIEIKRNLIRLRTARRTEEDLLILAVLYTQDDIVGSVVGTIDRTRNGIVLKRFALRIVERRRDMVQHGIRAQEIRLESVPVVLCLADGGRAVEHQHIGGIGGRDDAKVRIGTIEIVVGIGALRQRGIDLHRHQILFVGVVHEIVALTGEEAGLTRGGKSDIHFFLRGRYGMRQVEDIQHGVVAEHRACDMREIAFFLLDGKVDIKRHGEAVQRAAVLDRTHLEVVGSVRAVEVVGIERDGNLIARRIGGLEIGYAGRLIERGTEIGGGNLNRVLRHDDLGLGGLERNLVEDGI